MEFILLILFVILIAECFSKDEATRKSSRRTFLKELGKLLSRLLR